MCAENRDNENQVISSIVDELLQFRTERRVKDADNLKRILLSKHSVQVFYRRDGTIGWSKVREDAKSTSKRVVWSLVDVETDPWRAMTPLPIECREIPLIVVTVDSPYYRTRLADTIDHLSKASFEDGTSFKPIKTVDMLNLSEHPLAGANRIVFEGWRQILLPIFTRPKIFNDDHSIILIAEDDFRLGNVSPGTINKICSAMFDANPGIHMLSLGHSYAPAKPSRRQRRRAKRQQHTSDPSSTCVSDMGAEDVPPSSLLWHVNSGKGLHGSTLLALRNSMCAKLLLNAMEEIPMGKRCHFDQFLFHSTLHNIGIAFSDPPLVGWAEVSETLTSVGAGSRRHGGGRLEHLPDDLCNDIKWVRRRLS